ncbi:MAG: hypothetical protein U0R26_10445 [Solirubrobacterales bacterium]
MAINKEHLEFHAVDLGSRLGDARGLPEGSSRRSSPGRSTKRPNRESHSPAAVRSGVFTTAPFVHTYWEEVYLVSGDLTVGNDAEGKGGERFEPNTYACRPPGAAHGPFRSDGGCLLLENHYFDPA